MGQESFAQKGPPNPPPGGPWGGGGGNGNGKGPGCWPPPCIPINGGIEYLLVAGVLLGVFTLRKKKEELSMDKAQQPGND